MVKSLVNKQKRVQASRGSVLLEFALVLPVLLLVAGGMIGFGSNFLTKSVLSEAADRIANDCTKSFPPPGIGTVRACANNVPNDIRNNAVVYFGCVGGGAGLTSAGQIATLPGNPGYRMVTVTVRCATETSMWSLAAVAGTQFFNTTIRGTASRVFKVP